MAKIVFLLEVMINLFRKNNTSKRKQSIFAPLFPYGGIVTKIFKLLTQW